ncbi:hypothetical protein [Falsiroseomonas selenitidurans]|uniref:Uncharacterized protein n=1 Tax=Falsiroseomonas selenitidurans TaxID=2716335 RepID=A0ABX1E011_9PROT|nr:hypothetical protein [Falsiroseomonas selenitidurans]NKC30466.1 hypothetical protein [Falsiroseomonas selenitidurans]
MSATLTAESLAPLAFRARTPVRDFLRNLRRWLTYRPERRYLGGKPPRG